MTRRAFFVFGPESSGTRLVAQALLAGGCYGHDGHFQPFDCKHLDVVPGDCSEVNVHALRATTGDVLFRRSLPHGIRTAPPEYRWPTITAIINAFHSEGLHSHVIVTVRDTHCLIQSQIRRFGITVGEARANVSKAYSQIFHALSTSAEAIPFTIVTYESLILNRMSAVRRLLEELKLNLNPRLAPRIRDENRKYYSENNDSP
jgi:LPS sulfotransferase NodH